MRPFNNLCPQLTKFYKNGDEEAVFVLCLTESNLTLFGNFSQVKSLGMNAGHVNNS